MNTETEHRTGLGSATPFLHPWGGLAMRGDILRVGVVAIALLLQVCGAAAADKPAASQPAAAPKSFEQANKEAANKSKYDEATMRAMFVSSCIVSCR